MAGRWDEEGVERLLEGLRPAFEPSPLLSTPAAWRAERTIPGAANLWRSTLTAAERPAMLAVLRRWLDPVEYARPEARWHFVAGVASAARIVDLADDLAHVAHDLTLEPPPPGPFVANPTVAVEELWRVSAGLRGHGPLPPRPETRALADTLADELWDADGPPGPQPRTDDFGIRVGHYAFTKWFAPPVRLELTVAIWPLSDLTPDQAEARVDQLVGEITAPRSAALAPVRHARVVLPVFVLDEVTPDIEWWALNGAERHRRRVLSLPVVVDATEPPHLHWTGPDAISHHAFADDLGDLVDGALRRGIVRHAAARLA